MQKVWILVGLPGSGKSTKSNLIKSINDKTVIVSKDNIREMIHGNYIYDEEYEELVNVMNYKMFLEVIKMGFNLIIDECHLTVNTRNFVVAYLNSMKRNLDITIVHCCEMENNLSNRENNLRGYSINHWNNVIENMKKIYEIPTKEECERLDVNFEKYFI